MSASGRAGWLKAGALALLGLLTLTVLTLGYCLAYPNTLKPLVQSITEWALDRPLAIDGDLMLSLSMTPVVSVADTRLGNAPGGTAPHMVSLSFARVQIDLGALFDKRVHLLDLQVRDAELYLEDRVDGPPNWQFFEAVEQPDEGDSWSFLIQQLRVTDSRIHATIGELAPIEVSIPHLEETTDSADHLNLNGHGEINGDPWRVSGRIGPFTEILSAGQIEINLDLMVDDAEISVAGSVGELASLSEVDLSLTIYGPDADLLGEIFQMPDSFADDIALKAEIRPDTNGHALSLVGHVSDFEIETAGTILNLVDVDGWDGSAKISGPDLGVFGKALQIDGFPDGPFEIQGTLHLHGGDLDLTDVVVRSNDLSLTLNADFEDFPNRAGAFGSFRMTGDDISEFRTLLGLPKLPVVPFEVTLTLDATGSEVLQSTVTVGKHALTAAGAVGEYPDFHGTELQIHGQGEDIATLLQALEISQPFAGTYQASSLFRVDEQGLSLQESTFQMAGHLIEGDLSWPTPMTPESLEFRGRLTLDDLAETGNLLGITDLPAYPLTTSGTLKLDDGRLSLDESLTRFRSMEMQADGSFGRPGNLPDLMLNIEITGPRMDELFDDALADSSGPFELTAEIRGLEEALQIGSFELETAGGTFGAEGKVALTPGWAGSELRLAGRGERLDRLLPAFPGYSPPDKSWQLQASIELPVPNHIRFNEGRLDIGSINAQVDGMLDFEDQSRTRLTFVASGDRIADLGQIGDIPWPEHAFELSTDLAGTLDTLHIRNLDARWGDSDLTGGGSVFLTDRPFIEVHGRSKLLDVYDLQHALFGAPEDEEPGDDLDKVFSDASIPIELFADFDAVLDVEVEKFRGQRSRLEDISLQLDIKDGEMKLNRAAYRDETGYFDATALLRPDGNGVYMELALAGEDVDFGLFTSTGQERDSIPRYTLDVDIWGHGQTVAELAGSLNGILLVSSDGGQINNGLVEAFGGDFLVNVLETMNPFVESEEFTKMSCLVLNASIADGKLKMEPGFVMRTDRLNMFVYGSADLEQEKLDLSLATQARRGIGISAASITNPYFKIGGTLATPALELDPASAAVAASVATATAGLSILIRGVFDRLMGSQDPCPRFLEYEQQVPARPGASTSPPSAT